MKTMSAREPKNAFGLMIDITCAEPVLIDKQECGVVVVIAAEEYERLYGNAKAAPTQSYGAKNPGLSLSIHRLREDSK